ncbi:glycosyl transferase [Actinoplanes sp. SE50]|uniref:glycosyltransferase family 9 protein n=1 Tax=unclassified Actinoplanes TaxID=2626549 RepID=UPI00023EC0B2|nr:MULTISPECIES: glycosyltransferase family 9 protein [unclassified Actinoplanes]AEV83542.1 ADP-heptose-LPS heptosyltransferase 2 [Actinoplanes sp. SE50/110]ATO82314.1 glycosyl transferase [Actinoplanes sp. SE50]SLL99721.1 glycosyl transferase [Actinoplanes sp. SE50/110]
MILVLRALGVGDLATGVPALRALRSAFPGRELVLAAPRWLTPLVDLIGGVDRVLPVDGLDGVGAPGLPEAVSGAELAVNLHGSGPESHRMLRGAGRLWGFRCAAAEHLDGPEWVRDEHEVHRWCRMLRYYGVAADESDLSLMKPLVGSASVTVVHPGAKSASRRWPPERYAAVARELAGRGHRVVITGSGAERDLTAKVAADAGLGPEALPDTDIGSLAALIAGARLLISGDTGVSHLATGFGTPSVTLFGPMSPAYWGPPPGRARHRVIWHGTSSERGDRPGPDVHPALLAVTVDEALAAADHALAAP